MPTAKPTAAKATAARAALVVALTAAALTSPIWVRPSYYRRDGAACSPSYCYDSLDVATSATSGGDEEQEAYGEPDAGRALSSSSSSSSSSSCSPDRWPSIPCALGVRNECGSSNGQSPVDFPSESSSQDCVSYRCPDGSSGGARLADAGTCGFDDLISSVRVGRYAHLSYPSSSSCDAPTVTLPHLEGDYAAPWELAQVDFRVGGSEHTIGGKRYDGEIHLVHRRSGGKELMVIGVMVSIEEDGNDDGGNDGDGDEGNDEDEGGNDEDEGGNDNEGNDSSGDCLGLIFTAFEAAGRQMGSSCPLSGGGDGYVSARNSDLGLGDTSAYAGSGWTPYQLLSSPVLNGEDGNNGEDDGEDGEDDGEDDGEGIDIGAYSYSGSLTNPPCSGGVLWYVADTPLYVSAQLWERVVDVENGIFNGRSCEEGEATYTSSYVGAFRPTQNLGNREVIHHCNL